MPRPVKRALAVLLDIWFCILAVWLALCLRLEMWVQWNAGYALAVVGAVVLALPVFSALGLYRTIFRHAGWNAMLALVRAMALYAALYATVFTLVGVPGVPRSVGIVQPLLMFVLVGSSRVGVRFLLGDLYRRAVHRQALPGVLIYGAGAAGRQLASGLLKSRQQRVQGFIDDDARLHGHTVDGLQVYSPKALGAVIEKHRVQQVLLAMPAIGRQRRNAILLDMRQYEVHVRTLPGIAALASGPIGAKDLQELDIADILGRDPVLPDAVLLNLHVRAKVVLVTGAGGSIGSELCRQVLRCAPRCLLLADNSEFALYQVLQELRALRDALPAGQQPEVVALLASVQNEERMDSIMGAWRPDTVYHAAAYKHVPLVEHNPAEGLRNNVWGTMVCARTAARHGVANFVLVSTDKAVRPTNIMGASKRLAELVVQAFAQLLKDHPAEAYAALAAPAAAPVAAVAAAAAGSAWGPQSAFAFAAAPGQPGATTATVVALPGASGPVAAPAPLAPSALPAPSTATCFAIVRFGNVLGSSGSVVPLFRRQIEAGGPITLTHADVTRYFMTIPEASELVIQAGALASGGEVFVLDMGQSVRIYDLACRMVELSGLRVRNAQHPNGQIEIEVSGLRPGEKLYEELLIGNNPQPTALVRVMQARETFVPWQQLHQELHSLDAALSAADFEAVRAVLQRLVGYTPTSPVVDWVQQARAARAELQGMENLRADGHPVLPLSLLGKAGMGAR